MSRRRRAALVGLAVFIILLIGGRMGAEFALNLLWYRSLDLSRVFWTRWATMAVVRSGFGIAFAALIFLNLWIVSRGLGTIRVRRRYGNIEIAERLHPSYIIAALLVISGLSGWWLSAGVGNPVAVLAAFRHAAWNVADPVFGRDLGFYIFVLPILSQIQTICAVLLVWIAILVLGAYAVTGGIGASDGRLHIAPNARRHVGLLGAAFLVLICWGLWLDRYGLMLSGHGIGGAFGYTDAHARLPGLLAAALVALAAAAAVGFGLWTDRRWIAATGVAAFIATLLVALVAVPALVQKLTVEPSEFVREEPYITRHLRFARAAYALDGLRQVRIPFRDSASVGRDRVTEALAEAPLWDPHPLRIAFNQVANPRRYYEFVSAHPDRYSGVPVVVSARELNPAQLPEAAQTWQNVHLNYTSGNAAVVSPVDRAATDGSPTYFLNDIDPPTVAPEAPPGLDLTDPEIFFGEATQGYVVVAPDTPAIGIPLHSIWRKLLLAWAFQSKNLLLSSNLTDESRLVHRRDVFARIHAAAPFLRVLPGQHALPVISDGRVIWIIDAYTTTTAYPLSPIETLGNIPVRYARNSVKATVDASTGAVALYAMDPDDPILQTYAAIFPGLIRPINELSPDLLRHLRYSAPLLSLQASVLGNYHLTDPRMFYAREDVWAVTDETVRTTGGTAGPIYAMLPLPETTRREFLLTLPMVALGRPNLAAMLVARNDAPHYGETILYEWPRDQLAPGPAQIESRIDQDPEISQQLSLWKTGGSEVIRGHLITVPLDSTLLFLEPIYLEAQNLAIPQLERVILADSRHMVMRPTLSQAITALLAGSATTSEVPGVMSSPVQAGPATGGTVSRARQLMDRAERQLRAGDWSGFGTSWDALRQLLSPDSTASPPSP